MSRACRARARRSRRIGFASCPGGKGANQALAARRAGAAVALFGAVGNDAFAAPALELLRADGVDLAGVRSVATPTGVALIHVDDAGENTITVIAGANAAVAADFVPAAALGPAAIVVMPLEIPLSTVAAVAAHARAAGARVIVNAAPAAALPATTLASIDILVVNEHEAAAVAAPFDFPGAARRLLRGGPCALRRARSSSRSVPVARSRPAPTGLSHCRRPTSTSSTRWARATRSSAHSQPRSIAARRCAMRCATVWRAGSLACTRAGAQPSLPWRADIARVAATI